jgi:hypothetical protein
LTAAAFKSCSEVGECLINVTKSISEYPGEADNALLRLFRFRLALKLAEAAKNGNISSKKIMFPTKKKGSVNVSEICSDLINYFFKITF